MMLSLIDVPNPFSLDAAPKETIPTVPTIGAHDCSNVVIINTNNKFFISNPFEIKNNKLKEKIVIINFKYTYHFLSLLLRYKQLCAATQSQL